MLGSGQIINGRYRTLLWLADGGQSTVYLAADEQTFGRQVVLKEFKHGVGTATDPEAAKQQFEASARMLSQLNHPGIVQVTDYFFNEDRPILITEYIPGETLEHRLSMGSYGLPERDVISIADQLCDVLSYLHGQSPPIIYRDLTPGNVILAAGDKVKLIDFGIARTFKEGKTSDTEPLGTAGYAPPEQHGKSQTGPYSDVYSLGATLLHAVTGYDPSLSPFVLPKADRVHGDMKAVSPALTAAIVKATEVDIRKRYQSVEDFRRAIHRTGWRTVPRGVRVAAVTLAVLASVLLCGGVGAMLASAAGVLPPLFAAATPSAPAVASQPTLTPATDPSALSTPGSMPTNTVMPVTPPTPILADASSTSASATRASTVITTPLTPAITEASPAQPSSTATVRPTPTATVRATSASTPTSTSAPAPTATSTPAPTDTATPAPTPAPTATSPPTSVPTATPLPPPTPITILAPSIGTGDLPQPRIDGVAVPGSVRRGDPFDVTVWASNNGGAAAQGSITLSFPEAARVELLDADNNLVRAEPANCVFDTPDAYARVIAPDGQCRTVMSLDTCLTFDILFNPIAESWFTRWEPGKQHTLKVRVTPRDTADVVAVNVRAAMVGEAVTAPTCNDLVITPSTAQTTNRDQQGFPVQAYFVAVSSR